MEKAILSFDRSRFGDGLLSKDAINHKPGLPLEGLDSRFGILAKDAVNIQIVAPIPIEKSLKPPHMNAPVALLEVSFAWKGERSRVGVRASDVCAVRQYNDNVPFRAGA